MTEPFVGEIKIFPWDWPPRGWANCNGQLLSIQQNAALFSLLGTFYGGNGVQTFALPNLQGRTPMHVNNTHVLGQVGGTAQVTISLTQVPLHTHGLVCSGSAAADSATQPAGRVLAQATAAVYADGAPTTALSSASVTASSGQSQPHSNMQPYLTLNIAIALQGIFPSRN